MQLSDRTSPVLFLDIDGVLHPGVAQGELSTRLPLLEAWLRANPSVNVVVTSSWRTAYEFDTLRQLFVDDLQARVVGVTPELGTWGPGHRGCEVLAWLERAGGPERSWRALDDKASWFDWDLQSRLILCDPAEGLTARQIDQLDAWAATWGLPREVVALPQRSGWGGARAGHLLPSRESTQAARPPPLRGAYSWNP